MTLQAMSTQDWIAVGLFVVVWLGYEPLLQRVSRRSGAISTDMLPIRLLWMRAMTRRESGLVDANLIGHSLNSGSFFASANLILIAAVAGTLFGGGTKVTSVLQHGAGLEITTRIVELKLALVTVCLVRGLLDFIWSIRQLNYCLALIGAAHDGLKPENRDDYAAAVAEVLNPALQAFSHGVRGYYFALAAGAWLFGPVALGAATLGAFALLVWRQANSGAARGIRKARGILER
jgi:uncharacterized membrane protein